MPLWTIQSWPTPYRLFNVGPTLNDTHCDLFNSTSLKLLGLSNPTYIMTSNVHFKTHNI